MPRRTLSVPIRPMDGPNAIGACDLTHPCEALRCVERLDHVGEVDVTVVVRIEGPVGR